MDAPVLQSQQSPQKRKMPLIAIILGAFFVSGIIGWVVAKSGFGFGNEHLLSEFKELRVYLETKGIKTSGSQVRVEVTGMRARAIFTIKNGDTERFFFVEQYWTEAAAKKRMQELFAAQFVIPQRAELNGLMSLYIENDWDPEDALAKKLIEAFRAFRVSPIVEISL